MTSLEPGSFDYWIANAAASREWSINSNVLIKKAYHYMKFIHKHTHKINLNVIIIIILVKWTTLESYLKTRLSLKIICLDRSHPKYDSTVIPFTLHLHRQPWRTTSVPNIVQNSFSLIFVKVRIWSKKV